MNTINYKFKLDCTKSGSQASINIKKGDSQSRKITVFLYNGSEPYTIEEGASVTLTAIKADAHTVFTDCVISGNVITKVLPIQMMTCVGAVECELEVYGSESNTALFTPTFTLYVSEPLLSDNTVASESDFSALTEALNTATEYATALGDLQTAVTGAETSATAADESADAAAASATAASGSATAAAGSATSASTSATSASDSATAAAGSATTASDKATAAANSATAASGSADTASTKATAAAASASTATTKASEAATSASNAATSASNAASSATSASDSASTATTKAAEAANSASAAATSATNAASAALTAVQSTTADAATGAAGSQAAVAVTDTESGIKLTFTIPKGDKGDKGDGVPISGGDTGDILTKTETGVEWAANSKQAAITANGILKGDGSGGVSAAVAGTDYVAPSALGGYVPTSRTVNGKALSADIALVPSDVGAATSDHTHPQFEISISNETLTIPAALGSVADETLIM